MPLSSASAPTATQYVLNVGAVGLTGTLLGIPLQPLILAGIAGAIILGLANTAPGRGWFAVASVLMSALLGGSMGTLSAHYGAQHLGWYSPENMVVAESFMAITVGAGWPWALSKIGPALGDSLSALVTRILGGKPTGDKNQ